MEKRTAGKVHTDTSVLQDRPCRKLSLNFAALPLHQKCIQVYAGTGSFRTLSSRPPSRLPDHSPIIISIQYDQNSSEYYIYYNSDERLRHQIYLSSNGKRRSPRVSGYPSNAMLYSNEGLAGTESPSITHPPAVPPFLHEVRKNPGAYLQRITSDKKPKHSITAFNLHFTENQGLICEWRSASMIENPQQTPKP
jgi:hypothetical protein